MTDINTDQGIPAPEGAADIIETDYEIGQDNIETKMGPIGLDIHNPVFLISGLSIVAFVAYALVAPGQAGEFFGWLRPALTSNFDWFFLWSANIFVLFCLFLIVSPWGSVRLGGRDATPDYGYPGWFAMLFAAGMGIGLMFFGVLEPVYYFGTPWGDEPLGVVRPFTEDGALIEENVAEARRMALAATSYHWALHPWAIYAVVALALALFTYNKGLPLTIRSAFYPIFGERVWGLDRPHHRHPGRLCHALRPRHLAGLWSAAGERRAGICLRPAQQHHRAGDPDHRDHRGGADLGAART